MTYNAQNWTPKDMSQKVSCKLQTLVHAGFKPNNVVQLLLISMGLDQDYWARLHISSVLPFPVGLLKKENSTYSVWISAQSGHQE